ARLADAHLPPRTRRGRRAGRRARHRAGTAAGGVRRLRPGCHARLARPGDGHRHRQGRLGGVRPRLRCTYGGRKRPRGRAHLVRHRLDHQGVHRHRARHAGGRGKGALGRSRVHAPARLPAVRPRADRPDHGPRPAQPPHRAAGERRHLVRVTQHRRRHPAAAAVRAPVRRAAHAIPVQQRRLHGGRDGGAAGVGHALERVRPPPHPGAAGDARNADGLRRHRRADERGDAPRGGERHRDPGAVPGLRQHRPGGVHELVGHRNGPVAPLSAGQRPRGRAAAGERGGTSRDADAAVPDPGGLVLSRAHAAVAPHLHRLRAGVVPAGLPRAQAGHAHGKHRRDDGHPGAGARRAPGAGDLRQPGPRRGAARADVPHRRRVPGRPAARLERRAAPRVHAGGGARAGRRARAEVAPGRRHPPVAAAAGVRRHLRGPRQRAVRRGPARSRRRAGGGTGRAQHRAAGALAPRRVPGALGQPRHGRKLPLLHHRRAGPRAPDADGRQRTGARPGRAGGVGPV
ncbi:MAG: Beta-lactamase class C-like and penicillin binding proteins (PBPs) superfamily / DUF3471 domain, partial [uncultured Gemmatimonadetes bacterium]